MDLRIGVIQSPKELEVELPDGADPEAIRSDIDKALSESATFWITDRRGRIVGVPAERIAYLEFGSPDDQRRIGFGG